MFKKYTIGKNPNSRNGFKKGHSLFKRKKSIIKKGDKYNQLTAIKFIERDNGRRQRWLFKCDCGKEKIIDVCNVKRGLTKTCGKHGVYKTSTYISWNAMIRRCFNKNCKEYKYYGDRGITVCKKWLKFENFKDDMGERPKNKSIDRIDNNGNYKLKNCRWATNKQQARNRRSNHFLTYKNETMTIVDWANKIGIRKGTLQKRIEYGWSIKRALNSLLKKNKYI